MKLKTNPRKPNIKFETLTRGTPVPKNQRYWKKKLRPKDDLAPKNLKYVNDATKPINL
jgi:hypothetical protein